MENKTTIFSTKNIYITLPKNLFTLDSYDFISIKPTTPTSKILFSNFIFTSKNAVKYAFTNYDFTIIQNPVFYCVGEKTAKAIKSEGFEPIIIKSNAEELAKSLVLTKTNEFTFFCGAKHLNTLPTILLNNKKELQKIVVYETILTPIKIEAIYDGYVFYSPSGIDSFLTHNTIPANATVFVIGETTAKHLAKKINNKLIISSATKIESVVETIKAYYNYDQK